MTYEMFRYVFLGGAAACGIMAVVSVILFFVLDIPKVIGDLTGRNAKKAIENIRKQNEESGDKIYQSSAVNLERGKLTDKISKSGRVIPRDQTPFGTGVITEKISTQQLDAEMVTEETAVLSQSDATTLLSEEIGQTAQLDQAPAMAAEAFEQNVFAVEFEITFIHTSEVIA